MQQQMGTVFLFFLLGIATISNAIDLVSPPIKEVKNGDTIDLGFVGPGQTVPVIIDRTVTSGGIYGTGGLYDQAFVTKVPPGWKTTESKLYGDPLQITITADPNAPEGNYTASIAIIDEKDGEKLGNIELKAKVRVSWDIMDFDVTPTKATIGPGQPARFTISITNKGSASDVFEVSAAGPKRWAFKKQIYVPAQSTKTLLYEIGSNEEEAYQTSIKVVSQSSSNIRAEKNVTMIVKSDLIGDYKATNQGTLIFPIFETAIYGLAGLIVNLFG